MNRKHGHPYLFKKDKDGFPVGWLLLILLSLFCFFVKWSLIP